MSYFGGRLLCTLILPHFLIGQISFTFSTEMHYTLIYTQCFGDAAPSLDNSPSCCDTLYMCALPESYKGSVLYLRAKGVSFLLGCW